MQNQNSNLIRNRVPKQTRTSHGNIERNRDIPYETVGRSSRRKRQYISGAVLSSKTRIQAAHAGITRDQNAHRTAQSGRMACLENEAVEPARPQSWNLFLGNNYRMARRHMRSHTLKRKRGRSERPLSNFQSIPAARSRSKLPHSRLRFLDPVGPFGLPPLAFCAHRKRE